jgi:hypothetical protein
MRCQFKGRECVHAGSIATCGCPEWGEKPGLHEWGVCYNDKIGRDPERCE